MTREQVVQIACQRLAGWTWRRISVYHGFETWRDARAAANAAVREQLETRKAA